MTFWKQRGLFELPDNLVFLFLIFWIIDVVQITSVKSFNLPVILKKTTWRMKVRWFSWHFVLYHDNEKLNHISSNFLNIKGLSWLWLHGFWIYNYKCTYIQSVHITTKVVSLNPVHGEVYSIQYYVVFSGYSSFLHQLNLPPGYNSNSVESGVNTINLIKP